MLHGKWRGYYISTVFSACSISLFFTFLTIVVLYVENDPKAVTLGGEAPTYQWAMTRMAFSTCLLLDFISWLWTVNEDKSRLFYLAVVINGLPVCTYGCLAAGISPIQIDVNGRRILFIRYLQWMFTSPSMLYLYSIISNMAALEVVRAMLLIVLVILLGMAGSLIPGPAGLLLVAASFGCFYFVLRALVAMVGVALRDCTAGEDSYQGALLGALLFMTATWAGIPATWTLAYLHAVPYWLEELLYEFFDFATKVGGRARQFHM
jgi:bacteriorhodopsin